MSIIVYKKNIVYQNRRPDKDAFFLFVTMSFLFLLNCLRGLYVGNDTLSYYKLFVYYTTGTVSAQYSSAGFDWMDTYVDIGWRFVNKWFSLISNNYQLFISAIAAFLYYFTSKFIKKYSTNIALSVLLFFLILFHNYLNILRQAVAIVIILISYSFLQKKKYVKFSLCVLFAALFHKYAIVSLVLIPFSSISFNKKVSKLVIVSSIILSVSGGIVLLPLLWGYNGTHSSDQAGISSFFAIIINGVVYFIGEYLCRVDDHNNLQEKDTLTNLSFYRWINTITLCLSILQTGLPVIYRIEYFFSVYQIVGITNIVTYSKRDKRSISMGIILIIVVRIAYRVGIAIYRPEWMTDFPYHFYWQEN